MIHIALHFLIPLLVAGLFYRQMWRSALLWMLAAFVIDLDHLLADPIYDPERCSIGFHPLHSEFALVGYAILLLVSLPHKMADRLFGEYRRRASLFVFGLWIHIVLDAIDCLV